VPAATPTRGQQQGGGGAANPFMAATYEYAEQFFSQAVTPGTTAQDFTVNITPGGFLRGIYLSVVGTGGGLGSGTLAGDYPFNIFSSMSLESIDGTPILYPMGGYSYYLASRYMRPWDGDPKQDPAYVGTINTTFRQRYFLESRFTTGVVPNTDARAQYRLKFTVNTLANLVTGGTPTAPALTITGHVEQYAQPDRTDLHGRPNAQAPEGMSLQRFVSHESGIALNTGTNSVKSNRVGNLIRETILVVRDSSGVRADLTSDPIRLRLDNAQLSNEYRDHRDYEMDRFFSDEGFDTTTRPTGVYVFPRWHKPGSRTGMSWMPTTEASYLMWELNGGPSAGTLEIITEDLAAVGPVPSHLVGI